LSLCYRVVGDVQSSGDVIDVSFKRSRAAFEAQWHNTPRGARSWNAIWRRLDKTTV